MIKAWILVFAYSGGSFMSHVPPLYDAASCERVKAAIRSNYVRDNAACVEVILAK